MRCGNLCGNCGSYPAKSLKSFAVTVLRELRHLPQQLLDITRFFVRSHSPYNPLRGLYMGAPPCSGGGSQFNQPRLKTLRIINLARVEQLRI